MEDPIEVIGIVAFVTGVHLCLVSSPLLNMKVLWDVSRGHLVLETGGIITF